MSKIQRIQVFGERNSGTNYLRKLMRDNYEGITTVGGDQGFGWKHGDLGKPWCYFKEDGSKFCHDIENYKKDSDDVLFAVVYRNPIEWLQSMHKHPHHAPGLHGLDFARFLDAKWESYYGHPGHESHPDPEVRKSMMNPKELFESYQSVFELRKDKIKIFESFPEKVKNVCYVDYEFVRDDPNAVLREVSNHFKIETTDKFKNITESKFGDGKYKRKNYAPLSPAQLEYIDEHLDWNLENIIGYSKNEKTWEKATERRFLDFFKKRDYAVAEELVDYQPTIRFSDESSS